MNFTLTSNRRFIAITRWLILAMILIIPIQIVIFAVIPMPVDALEWLVMMRDHPILAILHLDFLYLINNTLLIFFYVALYITLQRKEMSVLNIALMTGIVGAILYYMSNHSIDMWYLAQRYFATSDSTLQTAYLGVAESYLDQWKGTAFNTYYVLSAVSLILFSGSMFSHSFYSKVTAWTGLIAGLLMIVPSSVGWVGMVFALLSLIPWIAFSSLVVLQLQRWLRSNPLAQSPSN